VLPQPGKCSASPTLSSVIRRDGRPATEATTAYLGYTREYFFVAFICKDKTPGLVRAHLLARDSLETTTLSRSCSIPSTMSGELFSLTANPLGVQSEGLYSEQNGADYSFDTVWDTWGKLYAPRDT